MRIIGAKIRNIHKLCNTIEQTTNENDVSFCAKIPHYQRPYEWGSPERIENASGEGMIESLFDDYYKNKEISNMQHQTEEYFMGTIVAVKNSNKEKTNTNEIAVDIIDGQQRLTTIFLLNILRFVAELNYIKYLFNIKKYEILQLQISEFLSFYINNIEINEDNINNARRLLNDVKENWGLIGDEKEGETAKKEFEDKFNALFDVNIFDDSTYFEKFKNLIENVNFSLQYDYDRYNIILKEVISNTKIKISGNKLVIDQNGNEIIKENKKEKSVSDAYYNAIRLLFEQVQNHYENADNNAYENYKRFSKEIENITKNLVVCIMLTENEEDAYTLFEVVNDRFMAVNKIDLIKNLFYKKFVSLSKNSLGNQKTSKVIEDLNKLWIKNVSELKNNQTSLILLIAISYITNNNNIEFGDTKKYKDVVQNYLNSKQAYGETEIKKDFDVIEKSFELCKHFYDGGKIAVNNLRIKSLQAELTSSHLYFKTFHLLRALKLDAVIPALTNIVLKEYYNYIINSTDNSNIMSINDYLNKVKNGSAQFLHQEIDEIAINLNKMILLSKNYELVRRFAKNVISNNVVTLNTSDLTNAQNEYANSENHDGWIELWKYGGEHTNHKVRVLFNRLYNTNNMNGTISFNKSVCVSLKCEDLHLDHLDAKTIPQNAIASLYYGPTDPNRLDVINALGNIMLLDGSCNKRKSDGYLDDGLNNYKNQVVNNNVHWIVQEIEDLLQQYHTLSSALDPSTNKPARVPTIKFFDERKKRLINYFKQVIDKQPVI